MSKFRIVQSDFWDDPIVEEDMTPEDKLFFVYLLTNPLTTPIGIYQITRKKMAFDLGYSIETIDNLLERFIDHLDLIRYNTETREIAIKSWGTHNLKRAGKPMIDCVTSALKKVMDQSLITYVGEGIHNETLKALFLEKVNREIAETEAIYPKSEDVEVENQEIVVDDVINEEVLASKQVDKNEVQELFDHYVSKKIIVHKKMTPAMRRAIKARLKDYTFDELKQAIDNYAYVYFSDNHWFTHKYPLADFMLDKDIRKFLDEADPIENFANKQGPTSFTSEIRKEDFDLS